MKTASQRLIDEHQADVMRQLTEDIAHLERVSAFRVPTDWCFTCGYRYKIWPDGACRGVMRCIFRPLTRDERERLSA